MIKNKIGKKQKNVYKIRSMIANPGNLGHFKADIIS